MNRIPSLRRRTNRQRRGAAHVAISAMLFTFFIFVGLTVDFAYMQLIRTELRITADAAAKAGCESLVRTQDGDTAKNAAVQYAAANKVAGRALQISTSDVSLGRVTGQTNGTWTFTANSMPYNSVRVNARVGHGGTTSAIQTFFGGVHGNETYSTSQQATAGEQEVEVCLCLDRSGSMMFDMSGTEWAYPQNNPFLSSYTAWGTLWQNYASRPHPTASRWVNLAGAINIFLQEAGQFQHPPRTALVTWGTNYDLPITPYGHYNVVDTDYGLPAYTGFNWATNATAVTNAVTNRAAAPICGGTNLSAGLDRAVQVLSGTNSRPLSNKVIILLTDGEWNEGRDPILAAQDASTAGIRIHTVSMLTATQSTLTQVAQITGGQYYPTNSTTELQQAFRDIAKSLPIILTD